jgi:methylated-DNA-[protein]-cysteine S-methyltransferase
MTCTSIYPSPLGPLLLASEKDALTGLWLPGQKYYAAGLPKEAAEDPSLPVLKSAAKWLDAYFAEARPDPHALPLAPGGSEFQRLIWSLLREIPYGETTTYGALAAKAETRLGRKTAARAVGAAVGRNPISIILPCHRVLGASGSLTGYAGGLDKKEWLLRHEGAINM